MSHIKRPNIELGSFIVGEVPMSLEYQYFQDDVVIDLTGFTVATFQWGTLLHSQFINPVVESASVTDAVNGKVTYVWDGDEFAVPGDHAGMFFVNDGTTQLASLLIVWQVCQSIGTPPVV